MYLSNRYSLVLMYCHFISVVSPRLYQSVATSLYRDIYHLHINKDDLLDKPLFAASCVLPSISYVLPSVSHAAHLNPFQHCGRHPEGRLSSVPVPVSLCLRLSHIRDERKGTRELNTMLLALAFFAFKIFLEQVYTGSQTGFIFLSFRRLS